MKVLRPWSQPWKRLKTSGSGPVKFDHKAGTPQGPPTGLLENSQTWGSGLCLTKQPVSGTGVYREAEPARSVCRRDSRGIGAAHHRRWAA